MIIKDTWTRGIMDRVVEAWQKSHHGSQTQLSRGNIIRNWAKEKWKERWKEYLDTATSTNKTPAHHQDLGRPRDKLHQGLRKAESPLAIQLRTEKVGFAAFLHVRGVPNVFSPACKCGWRKEDPKVCYCVLFRPSASPVANFTKQQGQIGTNR